MMLVCIVKTHAVYVVACMRVNMHEHSEYLNVFIIAIAMSNHDCLVWFSKAQGPALSSITAFSPFGGSFAASFPKAEWAVCILNWLSSWTKVAFS